MEGNAEFQLEVNENSDVISWMPPNVYPRLRTTGIEIEVKQSMKLHY